MKRASPEQMEHELKLHRIWYGDPDAKLTKREKFALHVMCGILSSLDPLNKKSPSREIIADEAVKVTDALLAELEKGKSS